MTSVGSSANASPADRFTTASASFIKQKTRVNRSNGSSVEAVSSPASFWSTETPGLTNTATDEEILNLIISAIHLDQRDSVALTPAARNFFRVSSAALLSTKEPAVRFFVAIETSARFKARLNPTAASRSFSDKARASSKYDPAYTACIPALSIIKASEVYFFNLPSSF